METGLVPHSPPSLLSPSLPSPLGLKHLGLQSTVFLGASVLFHAPIFESEFYLHSCSLACICYALTQAADGTIEIPRPLFLSHPPASETLGCHHLCFA